MNLLLVDDEREFYEVCRFVLEKEPHQMDWAPSINAAREKMASKKYDLVILDHLLHGEEDDGLVFLNEILAKDSSQKVALISGGPLNVPGIKVLRKSWVLQDLKRDLLEVTSPR